jgi:uncharacterized protein (DUF362 family)
LKGAALAGAAVSLADFSKLFAEASPGRAYDLAAVKNGTRTGMLDAGLDALGGIKSFVKAGQRVLVKPNIGWDVPPERGANTHPDLVAHMIRLCLGAGASEVLVCDHTCDEWKRSYDTSGIAAAVESAGGRMVPGNDPTMYRDFSSPGAVSLKSGKAHDLYLASDVVINMPVLKHHSGARMSAGIKNLMGVVLDRGFYHKNDLQRGIAEFLFVRKPDLTVVDAWSPMVRNGPRGKTEEDLVVMKTLLASRDIVAADAAAAKLLGHEPADIAHVRIASELGFGSMDLGNLRIARISLG